MGEKTEQKGWKEQMLGVKQNQRPPIFAKDIMGVKVSKVISKSSGAKDQ